MIAESPTSPRRRDSIPVRYVCWFSCGASSAVAAKLTIAGAGPADEVVVAYTDTGSEHPDNARFLADCEKWFGQPILVLRSPKYGSVDDVIEQRRFLNGPAGALCTAELKRKPRFAFQHADDAQVFGYTADSRELERVAKFRANNPEIDLRVPLVDRGLTKSDCLAIIERAGIELPAMYRLGYEHNNCLGCVKGGMGYWNRIRRDFPDVFARRARQEREIGATCIRDDGAPVWLDELDPDRGDMADEPMGECSLLCAIAETEIR